MNNVAINILVQIILVDFPTANIHPFLRGREEAKPVRGLEIRTAPLRIARRTFRGHGNVLYPEWGSDYASLHIYQTSQNHALKCM